MDDQFREFRHWPARHKFAHYAGTAYGSMIALLMLIVIWLVVLWRKMREFLGG